MLQYYHHKGFKILIEQYQKDFILLRRESKAFENFYLLGKCIQAKSFSFIDEIIASEEEICLKLNTEFKEYHLWEIQRLRIRKSKQIKNLFLPVCFEKGEDWKTVNEYSKLSQKSFIRLLEKNELTVAMYGFLPGFIYLNNLNPSLHCPRKSKPRKKVAAGTFAIGAQYAGIYSLSSPGGWNSIGRIPVRIDNIPQLPPVILKPGNKLMIKAIDLEKYSVIQQKNINILEYNGVT